MEIFTSYVITFEPIITKDFVGPQNNRRNLSFVTLVPAQVWRIPKKIAADKLPFLHYIWPFFDNHMVIFLKTEIQMVIFRCLTSLNLYWYKSYDKKHKNVNNTKGANVCFCTK